MTRLPRSMQGHERRLAGDESGAIAVMVALLFTILFGFVAIGVEMGYRYTERRAMQTAADAAAIAGALEHGRGNASGVIAAAKAEARRNGASETAPDSVVINSPPLTGPQAGNVRAVEAIVTRQEAALFSAAFNPAPVTIATRAVAALRDDGSACVLALDGTVKGAITGTGSATVDMPGCMIASNSSASNAIDLGGNVELTALSLWTAGGVTGGGSSDVHLTRPPTTGAWALPDPYAGYTVGSMPATCHPPISGNTTITGPAKFCGDLSISNQTVAVCETIFIDGGDFKMQGGALVMDAGCTGGATIVLTQRNHGSTVGSVDIRGNASVTLVAPSSPTSPYQGLAFFQDRRAPSSGENKFNGTSGMNITGAVYFPSQEVTWQGNNSLATTSCLMIVARTVTFTGNAALANTDCAARGVRPVTMSAARLSE